uniref:Uncharacterized protein n=1 Tax=Arundo donax TaxID=35708 RepID=A0A0A9HI06_ARUDO
MPQIQIQQSLETSPHHSAITVWLISGRLEKRERILNSEKISYNCPEECNHRQPNYYS